MRPATTWLWVLVLNSDFLFGLIRHVEYFRVPCDPSTGPRTANLTDYFLILITPTATDRRSRSGSFNRALRKMSDFVDLPSGPTYLPQSRHKSALQESRIERKKFCTYCPFLQTLSPGKFTLHPPVLQ
jgi:hypothetical protein